MAEIIYTFGPNHRIRVDDTANAYYLEFYDSAAAAWKVLIQWDTASQKVKTNFPINKDAPAIVLEDTATGGVTRQYASTGGAAKILDGAGAEVVNLEAITSAHLAADTIQAVLNIPILTDSISGAGTVAANERIYIDTNMLKHAKSAYWEISFDASTLTADGSADLLNVTDGVTINTITLGAGTSSERTRSASDLLKVTNPLKEGIEVKVQVTGDGTNSATLRAAKLIINLGIS